MDAIINNQTNDKNHKLQQNQFLDHCSPIFIEYQLMREFVLYEQQNMPHIYVVPSDSSPYRWFGVMFIHQGIYRGIILRFTLVISPSYPDCESPKICFESIPFHPLINPLSGELNTSKAFPEWKTGTNQIWQLILFAKQAFQTLDLNCLFGDETQLFSATMSSMFNIKALKMFREDIQGFQSKVAQTINECNEKINEYSNNDSNAIVFGHWNEDIHQELKTKLLKGVNVVEQMQCGDPTHPSVTGLSWVKRGSMQMFSKSGA